MKKNYRNYYKVLVQDKKTGYVYIQYLKKEELINALLSGMVVEIY